ncbi:MAG: hypothetical protein V7724_06530 [Sediminicola sp.]|tara:strand:- start:17067 stop:17216 length:150 start_codon:yes stop_codon:yes gene_type:complete
MLYLSPQIEALSKKKSESLIKRENSCGIFQDYGREDYPLAKQAKERENI